MRINIMHKKIPIEQLQFHTNQSPEELAELEQLSIAISIINNNDLQKVTILNLKYESLSILYKHQEHYAHSLLLKGHIYYRLGRNHESLNFFKIALNHTLNEDLKHKIYVNLGALYTYFGNFSKAIKVYNIAISSSKNSQSSNIFNNIAAIYFKQKEYLKAIDYLNKSLEKVSEETKKIKE